MTSESSSRSARRVRFSIFARCALIIALSTAAVATVLTGLNHRSATAIAIDGIRDKADAVTRGVAAQSGGAIRFGRTEMLASDLARVLDDESGAAVAAMVTGADSTPLLVAGDAADAVSAEMAEVARRAIQTQTAATAGDGFIIAHPATFGETGAVSGALVIAWTPDAALDAIFRANAQALGLSAAIFGAALAVSMIYLRRNVTLPLRRVGTAMKQVVGGDYDTEVGETERRDEIGLMARDVEYFRNLMADASRAMHDAIFQSAAFKSSSAPMILADKDFNITMANVAFESLALENEEDFRIAVPGFEAAHLVGRNIDIFHRDAEHNRQMILEPGALPMRTDIRIASKIMQLSIDGVTDQEGAVVGYVVEWNDVTSIRRDAAVLASLQAKQIGLQFAESWSLVAGNAQFEAIVGTGRAAFTERKAADFVAPLSGTFEDLASSLRRGETATGRFRLALDSAGDRLIDGSFCPILDGKGKPAGYFLLGLDITEQDRALASAEAARKDLETAQRRVVEAMRTGLSRLKEGDLTHRIDDHLGDEYETLRADFNAACGGLLETVASVGEMVETVRSDVREIAGASDDLSRRTEHQAATLEETAAALAQITAAVHSAAEAARNALDVVTEARGNAESSGRVVEDAVSAMGEIADSSQKISRIVSVIDDIAFQTNLLALNAGVEAARAGEAGRGFAVVASEVRALAQRSSEAAREIGGLISASGRHVEKGVDLVGQAGEALRRIAASVNGISDHVTNIAGSAQEQSTSLNEINSSMSQLDQVTQQNAAMFEETTAASQNLMAQAESLGNRMARFQVGGSPRASNAPTPLLSVQTMTPREGQPPKRNLKEPAPAVDGTLALRAQEDDWEDF